MKILASAFMIVSLVTAATVMPSYAADNSKIVSANDTCNEQKATIAFQTKKELPSNKDNVSITEFTTTLSNGTVYKDVVKVTSQTVTDGILDSSLLQMKATVLSGYSHRYVYDAIRESKSRGGNWLARVRVQGTFYANPSAHRVYCSTTYGTGIQNHANNITPKWDDFAEGLISNPQSVAYAGIHYYMMNVIGLCEDSGTFKVGCNYNGVPRIE